MSRVTRTKSAVSSGRGRVSGGRAPGGRVSSGRVTKRTSVTGRNIDAGRPMSISQTQPVGRTQGVGSNLPIRNYVKLRVAEIERKLARLSGAELRRIKDFEQEHKGRKGLLKTLAEKIKAA